jgi:hypothetical protein
MKNRTIIFSAILLIFCCFSFVSEAKANIYIWGEIDARYGQVDTYSYTWVTYPDSYYYSAGIAARLSDINNNTLDQGSKFGYYLTELNNVDFSPSTPGMVYKLSVVHYLEPLIYCDYSCNPVPNESGYYDPYGYSTSGTFQPAPNASENDEIVPDYTNSSYEIQPNNPTWEATYSPQSLYPIADYDLIVMAPLGDPHIDGISPGGLPPNSETQNIVRFSGQNLSPNRSTRIVPRINVSGSGVTAVARPAAEDPTGLDAVFTVADDAPRGDRTVSVSVLNKTSNAVTFRVGDRTPVITGISQQQGNAGSSVNVTITGNGFGANPLLDISGGGILQTVQSRSNTQIVAIFSIDPSAPPGERGVTVRSLGIAGTGFTSVSGSSDTSNSVGFTVVSNSIGATITPVDLVEKNGEKQVNVTVTNAPTSTTETRFRLRTKTGTGDATFADGSREVTIRGNTTGTGLELKIKGVTQSSQANNMIIETIQPGNPSPPSRDFTVAVITAIELERINASGTSPDIPLDNNPGPDGIHTAEEGLRIYPDKNDPTETTDRSILRVKATVSPASIPNAKVYFAGFDVDDPSADAAPIDTNDTTTGKNGNDNFGSVNNSKSGEFSNPQSGSCANAVTGTTPNYIGKIECSVATNTASGNFKVTMQPGDNFAIAASLSDIYRDSIKVYSTNGSQLINNANQVLPISGEANTNNVQGIRTKMLTVWRKWHLEVDSMGTVSGNSVTGMLSQAISLQPNTNPNVPGISYDIVTVNTTLESRRFNNGRMEIGRDSYKILENDTNRVLLEVTAGKKYKVDTNFTLYDDDDYNNDDTPMTLHGDNGERVVQLPDSFKYVSDQDGTYSDGKLRNIYASAYIMPEYGWASSPSRNYNQTNLVFDLNVEPGLNNANYSTVVNRNRDSRNDEKDDFWVGYVLIGYQGPILQDFDGSNGNFEESALQGIAPNQFIVASQIPSCDCYNSTNCPVGGKACVLPTSGAPVLPRGAYGSIIFQEVNQDLTRYFRLRQPSQNIEEIKITVPHELGHQFGLLGDNKRATFKIMDYSDYLNSVVNDVAFHSEHINIMRRRIKSPGE